MPLPVFPDPAEDPVRFRARMTQVQLRSLAIRMDPASVVAEALASRRASTIVIARLALPAEIEALCVNGWNTELLLGMSLERLNEEGLRAALQWAFPQAYYSAFSLTRAYFLASGYTESSHAGVIKKVGMQVRAGDYPPRVSFLAGGGKERLFLGLTPDKLPFTTYFEEEDGVVDGQIAQFLNATRERDLEAKKGDMRLKTKRGKTKKAYTVADWELVSERLGWTNILSLLYRKRIKSNYEDIDTFLSGHLDPRAAIEDLSTIIEALNSVHEVYLRNALGTATYDGLVGRAESAGCRVPAARLARFKGLEAE